MVVLLHLSFFRILKLLCYFVWLCLTLFFDVFFWHCFLTLFFDIVFFIVFWRYFSTVFFDVTFRWIFRWIFHVFWRCFFDVVFWSCFLTLFFDEFFDITFRRIFQWIFHFWTIASFRIKVPSILFILSHPVTSKQPHKIVQILMGHPVRPKLFLHLCKFLSSFNFYFIYEELLLKKLIGKWCISCSPTEWRVVTQKAEW